MDLSNPVNLLIAGVYWALTGMLIFFSIFSVYILVRYGKHRILTLLISIIYALIFLKIFSGSYSALKQLIS